MLIDIRQTKCKGTFFYLYGLYDEGIGLKKEFLWLPKNKFYRLLPKGTNSVRLEIDHQDSLYIRPISNIGCEIREDIEELFRLDDSYIDEVVL